jgi:hypothetical protein
MRPLYFILLFCAVSCRPEETGINMRIPEAPFTQWRYEIAKIDADTTLVGILDVINQGTGEFEGRGNVLQQERNLQLDSLQGTPRANQRYEVLLRNTGRTIELFGRQALSGFDGAFQSEVLDTLTAGNPSGDPFQRFADFQPGWMSAYRFTEKARFTYNIVPKKRYFLNFRHDNNTFTGYVDLEINNAFDGFERISVPFDTATVGYRIRTAAEWEFNLTRNGTEVLPPFKRTSVMITWFHQTYGIVQRSREPFRLSIEGYPSRFPVVAFPGERWKLILYLPGLGSGS